MEEDDVDSGFCLIYDGIIVCQQYLLAHQFQGMRQTAFDSFTEEGVNPGFVTLRKLPSKGRECIGNNRLHNSGKDVMKGLW